MTIGNDLGLTSVRETVDSNAGGCCGGGCCGGAASEAAPISNLAAEQSFEVSGMTCGNCVNHVTKALAALSGVNAVRISLNPTGNSTVVVESATPLEHETVQRAIESAGYQLA